MKKVVTILGLGAILFALPVFAASSNKNSQSAQTTVSAQTKFTDDAQGLKERIEALKQEKEELRAAKKAEVAAAAKNLATKKINLIIKKFEAIKVRVENIPTISADRKMELVAQIEAEIKKLEELKTELASATTVAEVNAVMAKAKTQVASSKTIVKDIVSAIHATHLEGVITKLNKVLEKLNAKIAKLSVGETAEMKAEKDAYAANIKAAQDAIAAKDLKLAKEKLLLAKKNLVKLNQLVNAGKEESADEQPTNEATE